MRRLRLELLKRVLTGSKFVVLVGTLSMGKTDQQTGTSSTKSSRPRAINERTSTADRLKIVLVSVSKSFKRPPEPSGQAESVSAYHHSQTHKACIHPNHLKYTSLSAS